MSICKTNLNYIFVPYFHVYFTSKYARVNSRALFSNINSSIIIEAALNFAKPFSKSNLASL